MMMMMVIFSHFLLLIFLFEDEDDIIAAPIVLSRSNRGNVRRNWMQKWQLLHLDWHAHVVQLHHQCLRGHTECLAFTKLQDLLDDRIQSKTHNTPGADPIPVQSVMASGLRRLAGCL